MDVSFEFASSLLHFEHILPVVRTLLEKSREYREECEWVEAERCASDAREFCQEARNHVGLALARLYLADFYRVVGELGRAMELCRVAYDAIRGQSSRSQRHNEAVAAYALGLLCEQQLFGNAMQALHWYQEALKQFKEAQEHWTTLINDRARTSTRAADAFSEKTTSKQRHLRALRQILTTHFDEEELKTLCFDLRAKYNLNTDYDSLRGEGKEAKARELVSFLERRDAIPKLVELGEQARSNISWKAKSKAAEEIPLTPYSTTPEQAQSYFETCQRACQQIEDRSDRIVKNRTSQHSWQPVFDIWRPDSPKIPFTNDGGLQGYIIGANLIRIDGTDYHANPAIIPDETNYYFALPTSGDGLAVPEAQVDTYVLVRQQWRVDETRSEGSKPRVVLESEGGWSVVDEEQSKESETGVVWESGNGWGVVDFKRTPGGKVKFISRSSKIVGGDPVGKVKGCVTALLEPADLASIPSADSPPPSSANLK